MYLDVGKNDRRFLFDDPYFLGGIVEGRGKNFSCLLGVEENNSDSSISEDTADSSVIEGNDNGSVILADPFL